MPNKMLIDASHPEETRVVVVRGNRIEEFDFESQDKKQLKGNIYLARVTRVEPSLQAAFVEYGGNRHGFLAFSEIHPDYYQIPLADRQALLRAESEDSDDEDDDNNGNGNNDDHPDRNRSRRRRRGGRHRSRNGDEAQLAADNDGDETTAADDDSTDASADPSGDEGDVSGNDEDHGHDDNSGHEDNGPSHEDDDNGVVTAEQADATDNPSSDETTDEHPSDAPASPMAASVAADVVSEPVEAASENDAESPDAENGNGNGNIEQVSPHHEDDQGVESVGAEDALEEVFNRRKTPRRHYKIQEVIKRRQILLVQVAKEERGNKGAALTTYLSLAGRYSVLMPNTARGGGISRKITNAQDRKRLKEVVQDLEVPQGMGVILRTAGESRTKAEIKRDYEYLMRLWETVRTLTLQSTAPALVYEEGSLIKRSVRDLYNKDIDEVLVSGEDGYREAKDFMRMLMPSHAKVVQPYRDTTPIFVRSGIEAQLDRMLQPQVTLKSGGYIIINQTEALVAIDVNSGRSTKEHSIEETALHTNLEAAEEVARQLRLRDLAGLIVIDFIDMEENRNNRAVEKRLKDHLKNDRARIQVGRISHFGLMEMSRQRIRSSVLESTTKPCPHCNGTGHVRSDSSVALLVVRAVEEFLLKDSRHHITVRTPVSTAFYVLNHKRHTLMELEQRFGLTITIEPDDSVGLQHYAINREAVAEKPLVQAPPLVTPAYADEIEEDISDDETSEEETGADSTQAEKADDGEHGDRKRRKRRRRRGGRDREQHDHVAAEEGDAEAQADIEGSDSPADDEADAVSSAAASVDATGEADDAEPRKRRRGKRGGRRNRKEDGETVQADDSNAAEDSASVEEPTQTVTAAQPADIEQPPVTTAETPSPEAVEASPSEDSEPVAVAQEATAEAEPAVVEKPKRAPRRSTRAKKTEAATVSDTAEPAAGETPAEVEAAKPAEKEKKPAKPRAPRRKLVKEPAPEAEAAEQPATPEAATAEPSAPVLTEAETPAPASEPQPVASAEPNGAASPEPAPEPHEEEQAEAENDRPKKAGWWQRKSFF